MVILRGISAHLFQIIVLEYTQYSSTQ